jgi:TolB-like protein/Tfp pilus assembly protein PilF
MGTEASESPHEKIPSHGTERSNDQAVLDASGASHDPSWLWGRIKHHKVVEWTLAYIAFSYALLHGAEMLSDAQEWPRAIVRVLSMALILGVPIAATLAWFHGHRAQHRVSAAEVVTLTVLLFVAGSVLWWLARLHGAQADRETGDVRAQSSAARAALASKAVAVLPFRDLSEKGDQAYFAEGMAEEVASLLGKIPGLAVIGTASSFQFKDYTGDLRSIGARLGVSHLVQGSVRRSGELIRVSAQLIDVRDGLQRWSDTYDRKVSDVLIVQDEIAASLARTLQITVRADLSSRESMKNPEAYDLYLHGLHALDIASQEGTKEAVADFQQVLNLQPTYAPAAVNLAWAYGWLGAEGWSPPREAFEHARDAGQRALRLDPRLGGAHAVLAWVHLVYDWDWSGADREVRLARQQGAEEQGAEIAGQLAGVRGQWKQAAELLQTALALDPLNPDPYVHLVFDVYLRSGRFAEAEFAARRVLEISPHFGNAQYFLGLSLMLQGKLNAALAAMEQETIDDGRYEGSSMVYYAMGRKEESDAALKMGSAQNGESWPSEIARVHAFRGELDDAMQWLERAYAMKDEDLYAIKHDPLVKKLEQDPRYQGFLRKMNFPDEHGEVTAQGQLDVSGQITIPVGWNFRAEGIRIDTPRQAAHPSSFLDLIAGQAWPTTVRSAGVVVAGCGPVLELGECGQDKPLVVL